MSNKGDILFEGVMVDVETGGLDPAVHGLTQVGAVHFRVYQSFEAEIIGTHHDYVKPYPHLAYTPRALEMQGRTLQDCRTIGYLENEAALSFCDFLSQCQERQDDLTLNCWAHNAAFDYGFIKAWSERVNPHNEACGAYGNLWQIVKSSRPSWGCSRQEYTNAAKIGAVPAGSASLRDIAALYGFLPEGQDVPHNPLEDAILAVKCLAETLDRVGTWYYNANMFSAT